MSKGSFDPFHPLDLPNSYLDDEEDKSNSMDYKLVQKSKLLSLLLRHKPEKANLTLDKEGWCDVALLLANTGISKDDLDAVVKKNDKQRFSFNDDKTKIRAAQGHSITEVKLDLDPKMPPAILYHGTKKAVLKAIMKLS